MSGGTVTLAFPVGLLDDLDTALIVAEKHAEYESDATEFRRLREELDSRTARGASPEGDGRERVIHEALDCLPWCEDPVAWELEKPAKAALASLVAELKELVEALAGCRKGAAG